MEEPIHSSMKASRCPKFAHIPPPSHNTLVYLWGAGTIVRDSQTELWVRTALWILVSPCMPLNLKVKGDESGAVVGDCSEYLPG